MRVRLMLGSLATAATLFSTCAASAATLVDTGPPVLAYDSFGLGTYQYLAVKFDVTQATTLTDIEGYLGTINEHFGSYTIALRQDLGAVPGAELYAAEATFDGDRLGAWSGLQGLDWNVAAGSYWASFEVRSGETFDGELHGSAPNPQGAEAYNFTPIDQGWQPVDGLDLSLRVAGYPDVAASPAPEPGTWALLLLGFAGVGSTLPRRRRRVNVTSLSPRRVPLRGASLLVGLALAAAASPGQAAIVSQSTSFYIYNDLVLHPVDVYAGYQADQTPETFAAFDASLGTLTGARLTVTADQLFVAGASIFPTPTGSGGRLIGNGSYAAQLAFQGTALDSLGGTTTRHGCSTSGEDPCGIADALHNDEALDLAFADLSPFSSGTPVVFSFNSVVQVYESLFQVSDPPPNVTVSASLQWSGTIALDYTYDPAVAPPPVAAVPEPATWAFLVAGFGGIGAALRRRREPPSHRKAWLALETTARLGWLGDHGHGR